MREGACVHFSVGGHSSSEQKGGDRGVGRELVETTGGEPCALTRAVATPFAERHLPAADVHHPGGDGGHRARQ